MGPYRSKNITRTRGRRQKPNSNVVRLVKSLMADKFEKKVYAITAIGQSVSTTGTVINVSNGIIEGDDIANRAGTSINLVRTRVLYRATASVTSSSIRFILYKDMFNQGTTPSVTDLLSQTNWISQYADTREMQQSRFKILNDTMLDLEIAGANVKTRQLDLPLKGKVFYNGTSAVSSSNGQGSVFLLVIGNSASTSYDYTIQTVFTDC